MSGDNRRGRPADTAQRLMYSNVVRVCLLVYVCGGMTAAADELFLISEGEEEGREEERSSW